MTEGYGTKTNHLYRGHSLATARDRNLVRPNVDTIYSTIFYDLSTSDLVFTIPEISDDRYWLFPFYDLYGNNFGNVGSLQGFKPGKYLLRLTDDDFGVQTAQVDERYLACVNSPTPYGLALIRILVFDREADMNRVKRCQERITFETVARKSASKAPALDVECMQSIIRDPTLSNEESVFKLLALTADHNQSTVLSDRPWIRSLLLRAGICNGSFSQPSGTSLIRAKDVATCSSINLRTLAGMTNHLGNNWTRTAPHILGNYGSYYNGRHITAMRGYLALTSDQAFYPVYTAGNPNIAYRYSIAADEAYLVTFKSKPKLKRTGFWSVTAYDADGFLIPNQLERYVVGDRTSLTWADGSALYGEDSDRDGEFQILVQPADVEPAENWMSNWLPAPAGGGDFSFSMRLYGAEDEMWNSNWEYPQVQKVPAFKA